MKLLTAVILQIQILINNTDRTETSKERSNTARFRSSHDDTRDDLWLFPPHKHREKFELKYTVV